MRYNVQKMNLTSVNQSVLLSKRAERAEIVVSAFPRHRSEDLVPERNRSQLVVVSVFDCACIERGIRRGVQNLNRHERRL